TFKKFASPVGEFCIDLVLKSTNTFLPHQVDALCHSDAIPVVNPTENNANQHQDPCSLQASRRYKVCVLSCLVQGAYKRQAKSEAAACEENEPIEKCNAPLD